MLEVLIHFKPTPAVQHVADARRSRPAKGHSYVEIIILLQEGTVNDAENVPAMHLPVFQRLLLSDLCKLSRKIG